MKLLRRTVSGALLLATFLPAGTVVHAQQPSLALMTAGQGSAFLPYGQAIARYLESQGITIEVKESKGSNENLSAVDASPALIGTAFMGSAYDAAKGTGWAAGKPHTNLRALFAMYETSFQIGALRPSGLATLKALEGKKVGVGPAAGPAEVFFRAATEVAGIKPVIVNGTPADLVSQLVAGQIDALWQGAIVPIPSLRDAGTKADVAVFGLAATEVAGLLERFPALSATRVAADTYKGQTAEIASVSAWNFVVAHKDLSEATAYALTKAVLGVGDPAAAIGPVAAGTRAGHASANRFLAFHPGAARYYAEAGVKLAVP